MGVQTLSGAIEEKGSEEGDNVSRTWLWRRVRFREEEVRAGHGVGESREVEHGIDSGEREEKGVN